MLVFETDLVCVWCLAASSAEFDFPLIEPALVSWDLIKLIRHLHLVEESKLFYEAVIRIDKRTSFSQLRQSFLWTNVEAFHEVGNDHRG